MSQKKLVKVEITQVVSCEDNIFHKIVAGRKEYLILHADYKDKESVFTLYEVVPATITIDEEYNAYATVLFQPGSMRTIGTVVTCKRLDERAISAYEIKYFAYIEYNDAMMPEHINELVAATQLVLLTHDNKKVRVLKGYSKKEELIKDFWSGKPEFFMSDIEAISIPVSSKQLVDQTEKYVDSPTKLFPEKTEDSPKKEEGWMEELHDHILSGNTEVAKSIYVKLSDSEKDKFHKYSAEQFQLGYEKDEDGNDVTPEYVKNNLETLFDLKKIKRKVIDERTLSNGKKIFLTNDGTSVYSIEDEDGNSIEDDTDLGSISDLFYSYGSLRGAEIDALDNVEDEDEQ